MFDYEAPKIKKPKRTDFFGPPGPPLGTCHHCRKQFPINELQKYYTNPDESYWLCAKCKWKREMKAKFSGL